MLPTPSKCPTCGGPVVVASSGEGTSHYVPANADAPRNRLVAEWTDEGLEVTFEETEGER